MNPFIITGIQHSNHAYSVHLGSVQLHFSYATLIGVHLFEHGLNQATQSFRQKNAWGPTTAKHIKAAGLDRTTPTRTEHELFEIVRGALFTDVVHAPLNQGDGHA